jgi:hypothetical protein
MNAVLLIVGGIAGASAYLTVATRWPALATRSPLLFWIGLAAATAIGAGLLVVASRVERRLPAVLGIPGDAAAAYGRLAGWTWSPNVLMLLSGFGMRLTVLLPLVALLICLCKVATLLVLAARSPSRAEALRAGLPMLFFVSGFAALIYQIVWQRALFAAFGVDMETITIVVAVFMLGLGVGSLMGGALSERFPDRLPAVFLACEIGIGLFGLFSVRLIEAVAAAADGRSRVEIGLAMFSLLLPPTALMGATLPVLTTYLTRAGHRIGESLGLLYALNTAGSALACFLTTDLLFVFLGRDSSMWIAAASNLAVGAAVRLWMRSAPRLAA